MISADDGGKAMKEAVLRERLLRDELSALQSFSGVDFIPNKTKVHFLLQICFLRFFL